MQWSLCLFQEAAVPCALLPSVPIWRHDEWLPEGKHNKCSRGRSDIKESWDINSVDLFTECIPVLFFCPLSWECKWWVYWELVVADLRACFLCDIWQVVTHTHCFSEAKIWRFKIFLKSVPLDFSRHMHRHKQQHKPTLFYWDTWLSVT